MTLFQPLRHDAPKPHPGVELVQDFVDLGEFSVIDLIDAWRTCCVILAGFYDITAREFIRSEIEYGQGLDVAPAARVHAHARQKLVDVFAEGRS